MPDEVKPVESPSPIAIESRGFDITTNPPSAGHAPPPPMSSQESSAGAPIPPDDPNLVGSKSIGQSAGPTPRPTSGAPPIDSGIAAAKPSDDQKKQYEKVRKKCRAAGYVDPTEPFRVSDRL